MAVIQAQPRAGQQPQQQLFCPGELRGGACPAGLEYLTQVDMLFVKQKVELLEVVTGCETKNKYKVLNASGQDVYFAKEESDCLERVCCGPLRGFYMDFIDGRNLAIIRIVRPLKVCSGCPWCANTDCCAQEFSVEAPPGSPIGSIRQTKSCCKPEFSILDEAGRTLAHCVGPCCPCNGPCCPADVEFPLTMPGSDMVIGMCAKRYRGAVEELFTDADLFLVRFPLEMSAKMKALMLGALFYVDYMLFEKSNN